jgi:hypothetical protein
MNQSMTQHQSKPQAFSLHQPLKQQPLMVGRKVPMVFGGGKINKTVAGGTKMQTAKSCNTNDASFL